jgi:hypothetical protein
MCGYSFVFWQEETARTALYSSPSWYKQYKLYSWRWSFGNIFLTAVAQQQVLERDDGKINHRRCDWRMSASARASLVDQILSPKQISKTTTITSSWHHALTTRLLQCSLCNKLLTLNTASTAYAWRAIILISRSLEDDSEVHDNDANSVTSNQFAHEIHTASSLGLVCLDDRTVDLLDIALTFENLDANGLAILGVCKSIESDFACNFLESLLYSNHSCRNASERRNGIS